MPVDEEVVVEKFSKYVHHMDDQGGREKIPSCIHCFNRYQNLKKKIGCVNLITRICCASVTWRRGNTAEMNQFTVAMTTRARRGGLMVNPN